MERIFEITVQPETPAGWPVKVRQEAAGELLATEQAGLLQLDLVALRSQVKPTEYGTKLGQALFRDHLRDAFVRALARSQDRLHVLLHIEDEELKTLRWEWLCAPLGTGWKLMALEQKVPCSFYLTSLNDHLFPAMARADLRALLVVANPAGLAEYGLSPFDDQASVTGVQRALGDIPYTTLATVPGAAARPTLDHLCEHLTAGPYPILHLVAHGQVAKQSGETVLYLAAEDNRVDPVPASRLLKRLEAIHHRPYFIFLSACESAAPAAERTLGGLAQRLVRELGVPAVLAMTERVTITTAQALAERFYVRLKAHGEVDLARVEACAGLAGHHDVIVPALYSRLRGQPLFQGLDRGTKPRLPYEPVTVLVPAGPFLMGTDDDAAKDHEKPQHPVTLPVYRIGQYPVTNRQYAQFIKAVKTQDEPEGWFLRRPPRGKEDHPVVGVNWYDAWAYCRWLSGETGRTYRLPNEAEWEKAARGSGGQRYPWGGDWGDGRCNADGDGTTPVTDPADPASPTYQEGGSPYTCYDMLGNVEEWTRTLWGADPQQSEFAYPYDPHDGRETDEAPAHIFRVHRGGSFQNRPIDLSCNARSFDNPENRLPWRGFRVVQEL